MLTERIRGPQIVTLPDGTQMSRSDLPPLGTVRWVASRKAAVVAGINAGLLSTSEAIELYDLSPEELESWIRKCERFGVNGLKIKQSNNGEQL